MGTGLLGQAGVEPYWRLKGDDGRGWPLLELLLVLLAIYLVASAR